MRLFCAVVALLGLCASPTIARAQSFNIDYYDGAGVPPSAHGAGAGQTGVWNNLFGPTGGNEALVDLTGASTDALVAVFNSTDRTATFAPGLPDDVEPLLRDYVFTTLDNMWVVFSNLQPGEYEVYTYKVGFGGVEIWTSTDSSTKQAITGQWQGAYELGKTHALHLVTVGEDGMLRVNMTGTDDVHINGMQLRYIPAPGSGALLLAGCAGALMKRRR